MIVYNNLRQKSRLWPQNTKIIITIQTLIVKDLFVNRIATTFRSWFAIILNPVGFSPREVQNVDSQSGVETPRDFFRSFSHELKLVAMEIE
jgi:hypothetical protein